MDTDNNSNSNEEAVGAQRASAEPNTSQVRDAAQELQASISRFVQEDQRSDENLSRIMDEPSGEVGRLEQKIEDIRGATERNLELIRNYRN